MDSSATFLGLKKRTTGMAQFRFSLDISVPLLWDGDCYHISAPFASPFLNTVISS